MPAETFDLSYHLGPGVVSASSGRALGGGGGDPFNTAKCSCRLVSGVLALFLVVTMVFVVIILYLACLLEYQKDNQCYYRQQYHPYEP